MKREIIITADGSKTIQIKEWDEQYHSKHGAIQEAYHVFIKMGLDLFENSVNILEIGFGTGLNAFITLLESQKRNLKINYTGVEAYPVSMEEIEELNYVEALQEEKNKELFTKLHQVSWENKFAMIPNFSLEKQQLHFQNIVAIEQYDLIYFDAFGARVQPELWTTQIFAIMFKALKENGVLVTYSAKGSVRRAMQEVGFTVERLEGPPGKREMLRATKIV